MTINEILTEFYDYFLETVDSQIKPYEKEIFNFMNLNKKEKCKIIKEHYLEEVEEVNFYKIVSFYDKKLLSMLRNNTSFSKQFLNINLSFVLSKSFIENYIEFKYMKKNNNFISFSLNEIKNDYTDIDYFSHIVAIQSYLIENNNGFIKICDKLPIEDFVKNIIIMCEIHTESIKTLLKTKCYFNDNAILSLFSSCIAKDTVISFVKKYGIKKEDLTELETFLNSIDN